jgi:polysaccharide pyruvyl transferase WcaK-like protein
VRIGLLSPCGFGNLGDAAIQDAVIQRIRSSFQSAVICGFTLNPDDTRARHHIPSFFLRRMQTPVTTAASRPKWHNSRQYRDLGVVGKIRTRIKKVRLTYLVYTAGRTILTAVSNWIAMCFGELDFFLKSFRILKGFDLLIVSGGGQLDDHWGGPWQLPFTLFKWAIIAKVRGVKFVFLSVGAESMNSRASRFFIKHALLLAAYRSFRDEDSKRLVQNLGIEGNNFVAPDLAFSLDIPMDRRKASSKGRPYVVGVSPMAYYDPRIWVDKDIGVYESYVRSMASFVRWLLQRQFSVLFIPSQTRMDPPVVRDIREVLGKDGVLPSDGQMIEPVVLSVEDLISQIARTDLVVASRYHGVLLSYLMLKPVLAISYHHKVDSLMRSMGQETYCLDINDFDLTFAAERFLTLVSNAETVEKQISARISSYRASLENQFDRVLSF